MIFSSTTLKVEIGAFPNNQFLLLIIIFFQSMSNNSIYNSTNSKKKKYLLITDTDNLSIISSIIASRQYLKVKKGGSILSIGKESLRSIIQMSQNVLEEIIILTYNDKTVGTTPSKGSSNEEEDSFCANLKEENENPHKIILDSEDINQEEHFKIKDDEDLSDDEDNNTYENKKTTYLSRIPLNYKIIDHEVLTKMDNQTLISKNYESFLLFWEFLFCGLILIGVNYIIHLTALAVTLHSINTFYFFYCSILLVSLFWVSCDSLVRLIKDEQKEIFNNFSNQILFFCMFSSFLVWNIVDFLEENVRLYLTTQTNFTSLFVLAIILEAFTIMVNFFMDKFYREYDYAYVKYGEKKITIQ